MTLATGWSMKRTGFELGRSFPWVAEMTKSSKITLRYLNANITTKSSILRVMIEIITLKCCVEPERHPVPKDAT